MTETPQPPLGPGPGRGPHAGPTPGGAARASATKERQTKVWIGVLVGCGCLGLALPLCGVAGWLLYRTSAEAPRAEVGSTELHQAAFVKGTDSYRFGHRSIARLRIVDAPADTDTSRWAMLHDGSAYRLYFMRRGTDDTLLPFTFHRSDEEYVYDASRGPIRIHGTPADADTSSFAVLHDGTDARLYFRAVSGTERLFQFALNPAARRFEYGFRSIEEIPIAGAPADTDWRRWAMLHDGTRFRLYAGTRPDAAALYQFSFDRNAAEYRYGYDSIPRMTLQEVPPDADTSSFAMLHDGVDFRFYYRSLPPQRP